MPLLDIEQATASLAAVRPYRIKGRIRAVRGPTLEAHLTNVAIGDLVAVERRSGARQAQHDLLMAQVVGFSAGHAVLSPFDQTEGIFPGAEVTSSGAPLRVYLGPHLLGSVTDCLGSVLSAPFERTRGADQLAPSLLPAPLLGALRNAPRFYAQVEHSPPASLKRPPIQTPFTTGVRAIDAFVTLGLGQRLSIFAEPGVGKSTLLGMIAQNSVADVNVIALIGERGREVNDLLLETLSQETLAKTVLVVSTSEEAAVRRVYAAQTATRIAEYFRDMGLNVLLQMDSLTRLLRAYREMGLAAGEIPVRRGYPPSVFAAIPRLIERSGTAPRGTITALYTLLLSRDLDEDPMVEEIKGLTDGHLTLRRELAERGQYPACDVLNSISRLAGRLLDHETREYVHRLRRMLSRLEHDRDITLLGGEADEELKQALALEPALRDFLTQGAFEPSSFDETKLRLKSLANKA